MEKSSDIKVIFQKMAIKWALFGCLLTSLTALIFLIYFSKRASERQIETLAQAVSTSFRPIILIPGNTREAQLQMANVLNLKSRESVVVLDRNFNSVYSMDGKPHETRCRRVMSVCWASNLGFIEYIYPLYFRENDKDPAMYVDLKLRATADWTMLFMLFVIIIFTFVTQAFGLTSALDGAAKNITIQLKSWSHFLKSGAFNVETLAKSVNGLVAMKAAADELNLEIKKIQSKAADDGKMAAQLSILKEISHDLKTPLSQAANFFSVLVLKLRNGEKLDEELVSLVERTLLRMGEITSHTKDLLYQIRQGDAVCDLTSEAKRILDELKYDREINDKNVSIEIRSTDVIPYAQVTPTGFYRIIDNLLRNAIHAVSDDGQIIISLFNRAGRPILSVKDNGSGISPENKERIFHYDFTTKPSFGTGMGLGIVQSLCGLFGADIRFETEKGVGTEFIVSFQPVKRSEQVYEVSSFSRR